MFLLEVYHRIDEFKHPLNTFLPRQPRFILYLSIFFILKRDDFYFTHLQK